MLEADPIRFWKKYGPQTAKETDPIRARKESLCGGLLCVTTAKASPSGTLPSPENQGVALALGVALGVLLPPVSNTHLTLPTILLVYIAVVAALLIK